MPDEINIAVIANDIAYIKRDVSEIKDKMEKDYVTREEFEPIKRVVYGLVTTILIGFIGALTALVYRP